jgi:predicted O-linked N-acetylglucosamine transferase (SPINDLY family)
VFGWLSKREDHAERLIAEGNRAEEGGDVARACELYRQAVAAAPQSAKAHLNLGIGLEASGDAAGARASYEAALGLEPGNAAANYNLGKLFYLQDALAAADEHLGRALAARADFADARLVRGYVLQALGKLEEAARELQAGLDARPADSHARLTLARVLFQIAGNQAGGGQLGEALETYRRVLQHTPNDAAALCNQATTLKLLGRMAEAIECYRRAVAADPAFADAYYNLGVAYRDQHRGEEAVAAFRRAIELRPGSKDAHLGLGHALRDLDRAAEALATFRRVLELDPDDAMARWSITMAQLPLVYAYGEDPARQRRRFAEDLAGLEGWFDERRRAQAAQAVGTDQPFELAYQEENNRELLARYGALCTGLMAHWRRAQGRGAPAVRRHRPLRVGIVSAHLRFHSVWSAITKGWFERLDPRRCAIHAFHVGVDTDAETSFARSRATRFESGPKELGPWVEAIEAQELDVLIYPEIGMDPTTVRLAAQRLAPVQAATWGHPETTGLSTIDYYLSGEELEPPDAQANYTERLVALPRLGCYFRTPGFKPAAPDLARAGVDADAPLFICPGVPIKYAPQFDRVFPEIARRLPRCQFVFFSQSSGVLSERLATRLRSVFQAAGLDYVRHVRWVPWQPPAGFLGWLGLATAYLDTIGFSGFNTALYAVDGGLPIVTREGRFLRGRLASGILKRLALGELVVPDEEAYVALAVRLAQDAAYRASVRRRMEGARSSLYEDDGAVRALEDFLLRVAS